MLGDAGGLDGAATRAGPSSRAEQRRLDRPGHADPRSGPTAPTSQRIAGECSGHAESRVRRAELQRLPLGRGGVRGRAALPRRFFMRMGMTPGIAGARTWRSTWGSALAITRVRAELGTPHEINFVSPIAILVHTMGTHALGSQNLTAMAELPLVQPRLPLPPDAEPARSNEDGGGRPDRAEPPHRADARRRAWSAS